MSDFSIEEYPEKYLLDNSSPLEEYDFTPIPFDGEEIGVLERIFMIIYAFDLKIRISKPKTHMVKFHYQNELIYIDSRAINYNHCNPDEFIPNLLIAHEVAHWIVGKFNKKLNLTNYGLPDNLHKNANRYIYTKNLKNLDTIKEFLFDEFLAIIITLIIGKKPLNNLAYFGRDWILAYDRFSNKIPIEIRIDNISKEISRIKNDIFIQLNNLGLSFLLDDITLGNSDTINERISINFILAGYYPA